MTRRTAEPTAYAPALVLIDLQKGFAPEFWSHWTEQGGERNNPDAERVAGELLREWRGRGLPVIHVRHDSTTPGSPLRPGQTGNDFSEHVLPQGGEVVYRKQVNSAFIGTTLEADLRAQNIDTLVIVGIQTDHCVSTTARMAGNLGFRTFVIADATATFDRAGQDGQRFSAEVMHATALASLQDEFATILTMAKLLGDEMLVRVRV